jgi:hypothetical protein
VVLVLDLSSSERCLVCNKLEREANSAGGPKLSERKKLDTASFLQLNVVRIDSEKTIRFNVDNY